MQKNNWLASYQPLLPPNLWCPIDWFIRHHNLPDSYRQELTRIVKRRSVTFGLPPAIVAESDRLCELWPEGVLARCVPLVHENVTEAAA